MYISTTACLRSNLCNDQYPDMDCRPTHLKSYEDPPLLFDLFEDPSEVYALDSGYPDYESILKTVIQVRIYIVHSHTNYLCSAVCR